LTEAGLRVDGTGVPAAPSPSLDLVGRDLAANLELTQGERALAAERLDATLSADRTTVDVQLVYTIDASGPPVTARLPPYSLGGAPVRTIVRFENPPAVPRAFIVTGDADRVAFDPSIGQVLRRFVGRGARVLTGGLDFLCFALCLIVAGRKSGALRRTAMAFLAAECLALVISGAGILPLTTTLSAAVQTLAASTVVVTALLAAVGVGSTWIAPLAVLFGLAHGVAVGSLFSGEAGYAGAHVISGLISFLAVTAFGQVWVVALLSSVVGLIVNWGVPQRAAALALAAVAAHTTVHHVMDSVQSLAAASGMTTDRLGVAIVLGWCAAVLSAGIAERLWLGANGPDRGGLIDELAGRSGS